MRAFLEFLRVDKDEANQALKSSDGNQLDIRDPSYTELLTDVRTNLQKKEKRLKDLVRSGNCIVKRLHKTYRYYHLNHELLEAQVELRLVSRALSMSRLTTDQIMWCRTKLGAINFLGRKVNVGSSFSVFPW
ncbi:hypothetical protein Nepgr_003555 [Nepenthes gracilis]|uniref:Uncharacterized protein n=1 Tax=Nepenthes gracilis TaxID=150966 RepID=A0AAD3RZR0_NEPGR|nr:hypothetical protein Nepgr_003555 [Nepenthes gracilis]